MVWMGCAALGFGGASLAAGCGDEEDGSAEVVDVSTLEDPLQAQEVVYAEAYCQCHWEAEDYADEETCVSERDGFPTESCIAGILFDEPDAAERMQCLYEAAAVEADCLTQSGCSDEQDVENECRAAKATASDECPPYPDTVLTALEECNESEPFWAVGDDGLVFGVDPQGAGARHPVATSADLRAIVCDGAERAWVVGDEGTTLHTLDAGATWTIAPTPNAHSLRAVAQAHGTDLIAVGDDGALLLSADEGKTWAEHQVPPEDLTGAAATFDGSWLVSSQQGSIFRLDEDAQLERVHTHASSLLAIAADHHSLAAAAVGELGALVVSSDGGRSWTPQPTRTSHTLHAVNLVDSRTTLAVGEQGTVVRLGPEGLSLTSTGPETLFGLHVIADGTGGAVGQAGRLFETRDGGRTWHPHLLPLDTDLRGLDQPLVAH